MSRELRIFSGQEVRMEAAADGKPSRIIGYAAVYNSLSQDLGGFREMVMPGAFTKCLNDKPDVRAMYNHERILGRTKAGTVRLFDDAKGLRYEIDAPDTTTGRDVAESIRRGDVDGSSFAFRVIGTDGEEWRKDGAMPIRQLRCLQLFDVGPVDHPAYLGTEGKVDLRSLPESSRESMTRLLIPDMGTPNLRHARIRLAESRFYVESDDEAAALADACLQVCNACDSVVSLSWKVEGMDACRAACVDCLTICQALSRVITNPDSDIAEDVAGVASSALTTCAKACKGFDHPVAKLCAAVCVQAAEQCGNMVGT